MKKTSLLSLLSVLLIALTVSGCGYNSIQSGDEMVNAAWADVINQYKRRADLIPNAALMTG